ncbi:PA26 p53-induced protein-domain-containing protein [Cunninghamella echinulata]|nr:PA26 p53-induced protein-domain-containing protein [Cunninghamella echinulata]
MQTDQWQSHSDLHLQENERDERARRLENSRLRTAFFKGLQTENSMERQVALEKIIQVVKSYMRMVPTKVATTPISLDTPQQQQQQQQQEYNDNNNLTEESLIITHSNDDEEEEEEEDSTLNMSSEADTNEEELQYFLLTMLRLSYTCPFRDVRQTFQRFLKNTLNMGIIPTPQPRQLSPSYFIPLQDIFSLESTSSAKATISYPRPSHFSFSPWSHDASDSISEEIILSQQQQPQQSYHRTYLNNIVSSSRSSSTSSLIKLNGNNNSNNNNSGGGGGNGSSYSDNNELNDDNDDIDGHDELLEEGDADGRPGSIASSSLSASTRGRCTGGRPSDEYIRQMLVKAFIDEGRLTNMYRVMSFFPTYYEIFQSNITDIIKTSMGPLHRTWRIYLAIMASAELQCQYLVSTLKLDFLQNGGDPSWLKGIQYCPFKLQRISKFILKLSRQPWRLKEEDILRLMTLSDSPPISGSSSSSLGTTWSKGELVQAILVISTFLGLGNFVFACGIAPELDMYGGYFINGYDAVCGVENELDPLKQQQPPKLNQFYPILSKEDEMAIQAASSATGWNDDDGDDNDNKDETTRTSQRQQQKQKTFLSDQGAGLGVSIFDLEDEDGPILIEDTTDHNNDLFLDQTTELISKLKSNKDLLDEQIHQSVANMTLFNKKQGDEQDENVEPLDKNGSENEGLTIQISSDNMIFDHEDFSRFIANELNEEIGYEEFIPNHEEYNEFMLSEYCWEDHGCDLVNYFLPDLGDDLDNEFIEALSITDWSIFHQFSGDTVDTSPLRYAIFFYVHQLMGITKDDYNYEDIPKYLNEKTQEYIQKVCRQPHLLNRNDWLNVGISLRSEEKCHMNLLISSARKRALLCYGLSLVSHV